MIVFSGFICQPTSRKTLTFKIGPQGCGQLSTRNIVGSKNFPEPELVRIGKQSIPVARSYVVTCTRMQLNQNLEHSIQTRWMLIVFSVVSFYLLSMFTVDLHGQNHACKDSKDNVVSSLCYVFSNCSRLVMSLYSYRQ